MTRHARWAMSLAGLGLAAIPAVGVLTWRQPASVPAPADESGSVETGKASATTARVAPTLYCEFTNFADQNPRVGFYFVREPNPQPTTYGLIFQRERDGTQEDYGQEGSVRPPWALTTAENPAVLRSPDDSIAINLYDYDPSKPGTTWFEAGLRSIRYLNLGGRCRLSSA